MPERVADLCRNIQQEDDPKKFSALIDELIRVLDEERAIRARADFRRPIRDRASQSQRMVERTNETMPMMLCEDASGCPFNQLRIMA
jgi:hypothetical protein